MIGGLNRYRQTHWETCPCGARTEDFAPYCPKCLILKNEGLRLRGALIATMPVGIYAISVIGDDRAPVKIGYSRAVESRLGTLQIGSPYPLEIIAVCRGRAHHEKRVHRHLLRHKSHGEWFVRSPETIEVIDLIRRDALIDWLYPKA